MDTYDMWMDGMENEEQINVQSGLFMHVCPKVK